MAQKVAEAQLNLTDVTTANVSTTAHGFAPKLPNDATKYLDGTGAYSVPAGSGGTLSGVKATISAGPTIGTGSWTSVNWDTEEFDTDAYHDTVTNTNRLTIPTGKGGKFLLIVGADFAGNASGIRAVQVTKNTTTANTSVVAQGSWQPFTGVTNSDQVTGIFSLVDADWLNVNVFQSSGGNLTFGSFTGDTYFILYRIGS